MIRIYILCIALLAISSCGLITEKSIKDETVEINRPNDGASSTVYNQTFSWESVSHATQYRLQISQPDFISASQTMVYDTIVTLTQVTLTLSPGRYEWRLRAENSGSNTNYITRSLTISEGDFTQQSVSIIKPADNFTTTSNSVAISWKPVYGATHYVIEVDTINNNFSSKKSYVRADNNWNTTYVLNYAIPLSSRGAFEWKIYAVDSSVVPVQKSLETTRSLKYNMTATSLQAPANGNVIAITGELQWSPVTDAKEYHLYLYKADSTTLVTTPYITVPGTDSKYPLYSSGLTPNTYYWTLKAIDKNYVESDAPTLRKFIIQ